MARSLLPSVVLLVLFLSTCSALAPPKSSVPILTVSKDASTGQYVASLRPTTITSLLRLVVDLGARYSWVDCNDKRYVSTTFSYVACKSKDCKDALSGSCSAKKICGTFPYNPYIKTSVPGELAEDSVTLVTANSSGPTKQVVVPKVTFSCASASLLQGLVAGSVGMVGLGRTGVALPSQLSSTLGYPNKFALCLPSTGTAQGVIFFGDAPYRFPGREVYSANFAYTPLLVNPVSTAGVYSAGEPSVEYFIDVVGIKVNGKNVPINSSLLPVTKVGTGGTKLSTVDPYTVLESSIYKAVVGAFARESGLKTVKPVAPFGTCFDGGNVRNSRLGPEVPSIELVFGNGSWTWHGVNSVVQVNGGVLCLALKDGGAGATTSIVVGGYQMENAVLQLDVAGNRFGVTETLLRTRHTCGYFSVTP